LPAFVACRGACAYNRCVLLLAILVGLLAGLMVNYLADVLPATRRLSRPPWWPPTAQAVGSYLHSARHFIVHVVLLLSIVYVFQNPPAGFSVYLFTCLLVYFSLITVIDIEHRAVMHPVSIAGALLLGAIGLQRHGLVATLLGGLAGFSLLLLLYFAGDWLGRLLARLRKQAWEETALGFGDVNLAGVIGLLIGWPGVIAALFIGIVLAGVYSALFLLFSVIRGRYQFFASIPYAPFMCLGAVIVVAVGLYQ
jgi:prepilin signal peptidase PulO-like enzyme (type II secretory pathway)